jgi:Flp pilus assembly pilin Flp
MMNFINSAIVNTQAALTVAADHISDRLSARSEGQAMVEYGLILVLVGVVAIAGLTLIGGQLYDPAWVVTGTGSAAKLAKDGAAANAVAPVFNQILFALSGGTLPAAAS